MSRPKGKAKPSRAAGGRSWSSLLRPALVVLLLLGSLVVLALLVTGAPAAAAPGSSSAASRAQPAADGKCEDRDDMCDVWHKGGACKRSRTGAPRPAEMRLTCLPAPLKTPPCLGSSRAPVHRLIPTAAAVSCVLRNCPRASLQARAFAAIAPATTDASRLCLPRLAAGGTISARRCLNPRAWGLQP